MKKTKHKIRSRMEKILRKNTIDIVMLIIIICLLFSGLLFIALDIDILNYLEVICGCF